MSKGTCPAGGGLAGVCASALATHTEGLMRKGPLETVLLWVWAAPQAVLPQPGLGLSSTLVLFLSPLYNPTMESSG